MRGRSEERGRGRPAPLDPRGRAELPPGREPQAGPAREVRREVLGAPRGNDRRQRRRALAQWGRFRLAEDSVEALRATGIFGTVELSDLCARFDSGGRAKRCVAELEQGGLLRTERFQRAGRRLEAVTLTGRGRRLLERGIDPRATGDEEAQAYLSGRAHAAQVLHDTAVYRAAQCELRHIAAAGGAVRRIRTERQLRRIAARQTDAARRTGADGSAARAAAAADLRLTVAGGRLRFPDLRIEWSHGPDGAGETRLADLEVVTADYRASSLSLKATAGFQVYRMAADGQVARQEAQPCKPR